MSKNRGQSQSRQEKRLSGLGRNFSNKSGVHLIINKYFDRKTSTIKFTKIRKYFQSFKGKTIVHYTYN